MRLTKLASVLALLLGCAIGRAQTEVTVFTYNDRQPFVLDKEKHEGLEYRLCDWLNKESAGKYHFTLKVVAAPEAKALVDKDELPGVLLGVNKVWFSESVRNRYLWTPAILWDSNLVISPEKKQVEYTGPASMEGLRLAGVKGFAYPALTEAVKLGKIERLDSGSEILALQMVATGKADVTIVSEWTFLYATLRGDLEGNFHQSVKPFLEFERCILVPPAMKPLQEHLVKLLTDLKKNAGWQKATAL